VNAEESLARGRSKKGPASADRVSVVTPYYNAPDTIMRTVDSALRQNDGRVEIIVVIDDGDREMERRLRDLDGRIKVLVNEANMGAPASRNRGLAEVTSPCVLFLDSDDYLLDDLLGSLARKIREEDAQIGFGPSIRWSPGTGLSCPFFPDFRDHEDLFVRWMSGKQNVNTASVAWSTEYLRRIGGWDESLKRNQDGELALRAILLGAWFVTSNEGWGVWTRDPEQPGITGRNDNLGSLLDVADKFLAMRSPTVPDDVRVRACAFYLYNAAYRAFDRRRDDIGTKALEKSRSLGFKGHLGTPAHVLASTLLGLPAKQRLTRSIRSRMRALQAIR
jgi:glycosyltransferase involved in cell wall biosynthesis